MEPKTKIVLIKKTQTPTVECSSPSRWSGTKDSTTFRAYKFKSKGGPSRGEATPYRSLSFRLIVRLEYAVSRHGAFLHHKDNIRLQYRCFDRLLLNGLIQPFQQPERVIGFFNTYREGKRVTRSELAGIADQYKNWVTNRSQRWGAPILEAPQGRRDDFIDPYFNRAEADEIVAILRAREPGRILIANGNKKDDRWHLQMAQRWVIQYNFYVNDACWGRIFVRVCPYFPFTARVCLNQHHWLATQMRAEGIRFRQESNAFLTCSDAASHDWSDRSSRPASPGVSDTVTSRRPRRAPA